MISWVDDRKRGVPPFGHASELRVFIDPDLLECSLVWAAARTWHDVFGIEPHELVGASARKHRSGRRASHDSFKQEACSTVIVVDASILANVVGDDEAAGRLARARLAAASAVSVPDLVDVDTVTPRERGLRHRTHCNRALHAW